MEIKDIANLIAKGDYSTLGILLTLSMEREKRLRDVCEFTLNWINRLGEDAPVFFDGEPEIAKKLSDALAMIPDKA